MSLLPAEATYRKTRTKCKKIWSHWDCGHGSRDIHWTSGHVTFRHTQQMNHLRWWVNTCLNVATTTNERECVLKMHLLRDTDTGQLVGRHHSKTCLQRLSVPLGPTLSHTRFQSQPVSGLHFGSIWIRFVLRKVEIWALSRVKLLDFQINFSRFLFLRNDAHFTHSIRHLVHSVALICDQSYHYFSLAVDSKPRCSKKVRPVG